MVAQERIKNIDASFTWKHPTEKDKMVAAIFMRTEDNTPYLLYCPICTQQTKIEKIIYEDNDWFRPALNTTSECVMTNGLVADSDRVKFYLFPLTIPKEYKISRKDIEEFFNIKVVD